MGLAQGIEGQETPLKLGRPDAAPPHPTDPSRRALWHSIDKLMWEIDLYKRQAKAKAKFVDAIAAMDNMDQGSAALAVDDRSDRGDIVLVARHLHGHSGALPHRILEHDWATHNLRICAGGQAALDRYGIGLALNDHMEEINHVAHSPA